MVTIREAKRIAQDWVETEAASIPNFRGAFLTGSINWKKDDDPFPSVSDVDLKTLVDNDDPDSLNEQGLIQQYRSYKGIALETTYSPLQGFSSPETDLADYRYAAHFTVPNILSDPTGELIKIQKTIAEQFARKKWVTKRIDGARGSVQWGLDGLQSGSFEDRMLALWFATGIAAIPVQADLRHPTIRKGGIVFLEIMENIGRQDLHESLLKIYGSQSMTRRDVETHLEDLSNTFDRAVEIVRSPSMGDYINLIARPVVIDGAREMVNDGFHREAMIWIGNMRTICQQTILQDAPDEEQKKYSEHYEKFLAELGLHSMDDFQKRAEGLTLLLEEMMQVAKKIVESNQKIMN